MTRGRRIDLGRHRFGPKVHIVISDADKMGEDLLGGFEGLDSVRVQSRLHLRIGGILATAVPSAAPITASPGTFASR